MAGEVREPTAPVDVIRTAEKCVAQVTCGAGRTSSSGSSFFVDTEGTLVTNAHVIEGFTNAKITLCDGKAQKGQVCYSDERKDIAFIQIDITESGYLEPVPEDALEKGCEVYALGYSNKKSCVATRGIISASRVSIRGQYYLQTDAAINPGNSGGPLIDASGRFVGMCSISRSDRAGTAFAVSASDILRAYRGLKAASGKYLSDTASCPHCDFENPVLDKYCHNCGASLVWFSFFSKARSGPIPESQSSIPGGADPVGLKECPSCQFPNDSEKTYCANCGIKMLEKEDSD